MCLWITHITQEYGAMAMAMAMVFGVVVFSWFVFLFLVACFYVTYQDFCCVACAHYMVRLYGLIIWFVHSGDTKL